MTVESGGTSPALLLGALVGLVGLAVLVFVATLWYLRTQDKKRAGTDQPGRAGRREPRRLPAGQEEAAPAPALDDSARPGEVMRVIRDAESGRVLVEVGRRRYAHIREIEDALVGRRILWAIADLVRFTGGMATNPRAVRSASEGMSWEQAPSGPASPAPAARAAPASSDASTGVASPASLGQSMGEFFRRGFSPPSSAGTTPQPGSFVEQIEAILQARLRALDTPLPDEVHVSSGLGQRLQIQVGHAFYGSVDEVPDPQVRALIRAAVDEWERG